MTFHEFEANLWVVFNSWFSPQRGVAIGFPSVITSPKWGILTLALFFLPGCTDRGDSAAARENEGTPLSQKIDIVPFLDSKRLFLRSDVALVADSRDGSILYERKADIRRPIASLTKLMTAMVILDKGLPMNEIIAITKADRDRLRGSGSRLSFGSWLTREDLIRITLAGSDNRAAAALGRTYPGGTKAFVAAMNDTAARLEMQRSVFEDPAGLRRGNLSTARDLSILARAAYRYPLIREATTAGQGLVVDQQKGRAIEFMNTNRLVRSAIWNISLGKTGYISEAGHCLLMRAEVAGRPLIMVLLNSWGELSKFGDANRIRKWLEQAHDRALEAVASPDEAADSISAQPSALGE